jgi:hypothetical protein
MAKSTEVWPYREELAVPHTSTDVVINFIQNIYLSVVIVYSVLYFARIILCKTHVATNSIHKNVNKNGKELMERALKNGCLVSKF